VSHKHHLIIRVGAGLIQFVNKLHSRLATELTLDKVDFSPWFSRAFLILLGHLILHLLVLALDLFIEEDLVLVLISFLGFVLALISVTFILATRAVLVVPGPWLQTPCFAVCLAFFRT